MNFPDTIYKYIMMINLNGRSITCLHYRMGPSSSSLATSRIIVHSIFGKMISYIFFVAAFIITSKTGSEIYRIS